LLNLELDLVVGVVGGAQSPEEGASGGGALVGGRDGGGAVPLGGGRGETANHRVGASLSTRRRRGSRVGVGVVNSVRGGVGALLEFDFLLGAPTQVGAQVEVLPKLLLCSSALLFDTLDLRDFRTKARSSTRSNHRAQHMQSNK
jgi:hypothetical protein